MSGARGSPELDVSPRLAAGGFMRDAGPTHEAAEAHDGLGSHHAHAPGYVASPGPSPPAGAVGRFGPGAAAEANEHGPTGRFPNTPFYHPPSDVVHDLAAALPPPHFDAGPSPPASRGGRPASVAFAPPPGEADASSSPTRRPPGPLVRTMPPSSNAYSGYSVTSRANSPQRPQRLLVSTTLKRFQSARERPAGPHHYACVDRPESLDEADLEITLQHANRIEKLGPEDLRLFGAGEKPWVHGRKHNNSKIKAIIKAPEITRYAYYMPSDMTDSAATGAREVVSVALGRVQYNIFVQPFVLWPSLMRPPRWLRKDFLLNKKATVEVDWYIGRRASLFLRVMRRLDMARGQHLNVWACKRRYGPGETFTLYGAEGTAEPTERSYLVLLKFYERREGPRPAAVNAAAVAASPGATPAAAGVSVYGSADTLAPAPSVGGPQSGPSMFGAQSAPSIMGPQSGRSVFGAQSMGPQNTFKLHSRAGALEEVRMHMQLLAVSSEMPAKYTIPEASLVTWDTALDYAIASRDGVALRTLIDSHYVDHLLKRQDYVDKVEKVAAINNDVALMLLLYDHTAIEMDLRVLAFLIHAWASHPVRYRGTRGTTLAAQEDYPDLPEGVDPDFNVADEVEQFLVKYAVQRRNPLSTTAAILCGIQDEITRHDENRRVMRLSYSRFHSLHLALLRRLNRYADARNVRQIERILQPVASPNTVNEVSPLQVAFDFNDMKFMTETLIEVYVKVQWTGAELLTLTAHEDMRSAAAMNPLLAYAVLHSMGFAGKGTAEPLLVLASRMWHAYAFTSTAFFNSPRGRWAVHVMFELVFLTLYQTQVMFPRLKHPWITAVHCVFLSFLIGNLLDMAQYVYFRYGSLASIRRYMSDPWNVLGLIVNGSLLILTSLKIAQDLGAPGVDDFSSFGAIHMCTATLAVLVWVRALGMAVPVYPSLGPLLNTVARMVEEVVAFLFPMIIVMTGFSTMMSAVYQETVPAYGNFLSAMLQLFASMLGNFDFTLFDDLNTSQRLYGIITQVVFLVASAILLMNLLVAIMTQRYRPEAVEAETQFKKAQVVTFYQTQVTHNLICSPFNLLYVILRALKMPCGSRQKLSGSGLLTTKLGVLPLDGVVLPDDVRERPTGLGEFPHLVFLFTLYPLMAVCTWLLFLAYSPFAVWTFARKQYARLAKEYGHRHLLQRLRDMRKEAARQSEAKRRLKAGATDSVPRDTRSKGTRSAGDEESPPPEQGTEAGGAANGARASEASKASGGTTDANYAAQFRKFKKAMQAQQQELGLTSSSYFVVGTGVLLVVGVVLYLLMLFAVLLGWCTIYQWVAKVVFSLHNIFVRPIGDYVKTARRSRRVAPSPQHGAAAAATRAPAAAASAPPAADAGVSTFLSPFARPLNRISGGVAAEDDPQREAQAQLHRRRKALMHWRHALQRVLASKNERYMSHRDVLKALSNSLFRPHLEDWNLNADVKSTSQDIRDEQMQDLEDDDDPWDDDEVAQDDGALMQRTILDRTESLAEMLKQSMQAQQALQAQVATLAAELSRVSGGGVVHVQAPVRGGLAVRARGAAGGSGPAHASITASAGSPVRVAHGDAPPLAHARGGPQAAPPAAGGVHVFGAHEPEHGAPRHVRHVGAAEDLPLPTAVSVLVDESVPHRADAHGRAAGGNHHHVALDGAGEAAAAAARRRPSRAGFLADSAPTGVPAEEAADDAADEAAPRLAPRHASVTTAHGAHTAHLATQEPSQLRGAGEEEEQREHIQQQQQQVQVRGSALAPAALLPTPQRAGLLHPLPQGAGSALPGSAFAAAYGGGGGAAGGVTGGRPSASPPPQLLPLPPLPHAQDGPELTATTSIHVQALPGSPARGSESADRQVGPVALEAARAVLATAHEVLAAAAAGADAYDDDNGSGDKDLVAPSEDESLADEATAVVRAAGSVDSLPPLPPGSRNSGSGHGPAGGAPQL